MVRAIVWAAALSFSLCACGGSTNRSVVRTDANSTQGGDLSGYWNDIDAQQVSKKMVDEVLGMPWLADFEGKNPGEKPVVKLRGVIKRTDDRNVNEQYFTKQIERTLLNSGRVRVVASESQEQINEAERRRQAEHASDETAKNMQNEVGADFTLQTIVNSQNETDGEGHSVRAYLVNMELLTVESNEKVWIGEHKIRKVVTQSKVGW